MGDVVGVGLPAVLFKKRTGTVGVDLRCFVSH